MLPNLTGKELEALVKERAVEYKNMRIAHITACGVQATRTNDDWLILRSLPDFEGVTQFGAQFIFDCKVCSDASFNLTKYRQDTKAARYRQLKHMRERARYGVPCFFMIHWNSREGARFKEPAESFLFPIDDRLEFWHAFDRGEKKSFTRSDCREIGVPLEWSIYGQGKKPRPDLIMPVLARIETGVWREDSISQIVSM